jgi:hypothetical protein
MTICIAALCDEGKGCVIAADREITDQALSLEFEHRESKIDLLSKKCVVMSSGDALLPAEIIAKTRLVIPVEEEVMILSLAEKLRDTYIAVHLERAESVILKPRGFNFQEFKEKGAQQLLPQVYQEVTNQLFIFGINAVEFLVAGVDNTGSHIFRVHYNGMAGGSWLEWCDKLGHREIGRGAPHASIFLSIEGQYSGLGVAETIYNVYCAKKIAELAPGVGSSTDLAIISENGVLFADKTMLDTLLSLHNDAKKKKPDVSKIASIYQEMQKDNKSISST